MYGKVVGLEWVQDSGSRYSLQTTRLHFFLASRYDLLRHLLRNLTLSFPFEKSESLDEWVVRKFVALDRKLKIC